MGGNALKAVKTRRYAADEYCVLRDTVLTTLRNRYPNRRIEDIRAYRAKPSFGDLDVLFEADNFTDDVYKMLEELFQPKQIVKNSSVWSFEFNEFQVDLIFTTKKMFTSSANYFAWNDLGNLMGRVAHKLGFKYGHDGLSFMVRDGTHQYAEIHVSSDIVEILKFLKYDPSRFLQGFDTLEEIFQFAASSEYFNKEIYSLDNRNHASRIRDKKRKTYTEFLSWIETAENLPAYPWADLKEVGGYQYKEVFIKRAFEFFPDFKENYNATMASFNTWQIAKSKFNGQIVSRLTGLIDKQLGEFIVVLKAKVPGSLSEWAASTPQSDIHDWILMEFNQWKTSPALA